MKPLILAALLLCTQGHAQERRYLPDLRSCIAACQRDVKLYTENYRDHSRETDVMTALNAMGLYVDSTNASKEYPILLLRRNFKNLRTFFLTLNNKTAISTSLLFTTVPYHFFSYNDTIGLYIAAIKDADVYSEKNNTEKAISSTVFADCVLPSFKSLTSFKESDIRYFAISVYYGCKDSRQRDPDAPNLKPYCLTFVGRYADIKKYNDGYLAVEDVLANSEIYLSSDDTANDFRRIKISLE